MEGQLIQLQILQAQLALKDKDLEAQKVQIEGQKFLKEKEIESQKFQIEGQKLDLEIIDKKLALKEKDLEIIKASRENTSHSSTLISLIDDSKLCRIFSSTKCC